MAELKDIAAALHVAFDAAEELERPEELGKLLISISKERKKTGRVIFRELLKEKLAVHFPPKGVGQLGFFKNIRPEYGDQYYYLITSEGRVSICKNEISEVIMPLGAAMEKMIEVLEADGYFVIS